MTKRPARITSTKTTHRHGLVLIAGACCALLFLAYALPYLLIAVGVAPQKVRQLTPLWACARAETAAGNALQVYGRKAALAPNVVFLAIDTQTFEQGDLLGDEREHPALQMMGATPPGSAFPRAVYPHIIQRLADAGAKAVIFDIMFPTEKEGDQAIREAFDKYRNVVVIGANLQEVETEDGRGFRHMITPPSPSLISGNREYDDRVGFVNFVPDESDFIVRRTPYRTTVEEFFGNVTVGQPELLSLAARGATKAGFGHLVPPGHEPTMFRYVVNPHPYSLHDIFVPRLWEKSFRNGEFFRDKLVLIGPAGNWSKDELQTPFGTMLGPVIHLSALNALLTRNFLRQSHQWTDILLLVLGSAAAVAAGLAVADPVARTGVLLGIAAAFIAAAFLLYNVNGLMLNLLGPTVALLSSGFVGLFWERKLEAQEKARVRSTLERYVSRDVVKEILDNPASYLNTAGGMRKPITLLFSDIRGFTAMTESGDETKLVTQLNEYFSEMVRIVFAHRGTLDKFIGDAVMAHWGGIVSRGEGPDACRAVAAALDMLQALPKLNAAWKERGFQEWRIGVGVNHGDAICANIGSDEKYEFTAIGDAVNFASRLEGATKTFHQDLLIGEKAARLVGDHYVLRSVDFLQVLGKTRPVEIFTVLGDRNEMKEPAWLAIYTEGIRLFRGRKFDEAHARFVEVLAQNPGDWLAKEYVRRCEEFKAAGPAENWDGSYVMQTKK